RCAGAGTDPNGRIMFLESLSLKGLLTSGPYVQACADGLSQDRPSMRGRENSMDVGAVSNSTSTALQGLKKAQDQLQQAANSIAGGSQDPEDVVSLSPASIGFKANAAVIRTDDQMQQSLLDITA